METIYQLAIILALCLGIAACAWSLGHDAGRRQGRRQERHRRAALRWRYQQILR